MKGTETPRLIPPKKKKAKCDTQIVVIIRREIPFMSLSFTSGDSSENIYS
jgi:hypothetical protein